MKKQNTIKPLFWPTYITIDQFNKITNLMW